jgi:hypothetical protein
MSRSTFPLEIDTFTTKTDITIADLALVNRYRELKSKYSLTASEQAELSSLTVSLASKMMSPEDFNKLQDCIVALEIFVKYNVDDYFKAAQANAMEQLLAEISKFKFMGGYNPAIYYYHMNVVKHEGAVYFCLQDNIGQPPSNTNYWFKMAEKGSKGDPGLGLHFVGAYDSTKAYSINDAVSYDDGYGYKIYYALQPSIDVPPTDTNYWDVFLDIGQFSSLIGDMSELSTTSKDTLVNAINEVISNALKLGETSNTAYRGDRGKIAYEHSQSEHAPVDIDKFFVAGGTGTAITVTTGYFNLKDKQTFTFIASANNNGVYTTINADGKGARSVYKPNTTTPPTFIAGKAYTVWYDASKACFFTEASAEGNATADSVLAGRTFSNDEDTGLVGTMPDQSGKTVSSAGFTRDDTTIKVKLQKGYYDTSSQVTISDPDFVADNIRAGKEIFGINGAFTADATATASQILSGKTAYVKGNKITGTMPNNGAKIITPSTVNQAIPAGYHSGSGYVQGSANLKPENIKSGVNIFGVIGTSKPITDEKKIVTGTGTFTISGSFTQYIPLTSLSITPEGFFVYLDGIKHAEQHRDCPYTKYIAATIKENGVWNNYIIREGFEYSTYGVFVGYSITVTYEEDNQRLKIRGAKLDSSKPTRGFVTSNVSFKWWAFGN